MAPLREMFKPACMKEQLVSAGISWNWTSVKLVAEAAAEHPQLSKLLSASAEGAAAADDTNNAVDGVKEAQRTASSGGRDVLGWTCIYKDVWAAVEPFLDGEWRTFENSPAACEELQTESA